MLNVDRYTKLGVLAVAAALAGGFAVAWAAALPLWMAPILALGIIGIPGAVAMPIALYRIYR